MSESEMAPRSIDERIVLFLPPVDIARANETLLSAGYDCVATSRFNAALDDLAAGAGVLVVSSDCLLPAVFESLRSYLQQQPAWSDLPLVYLAETTVTPAQVTRDYELGNVSLVRQPFRPSDLISAVRSALRARQRQYQSRDLLNTVSTLLKDREEVDKRKDDFIALLAHELRNPLAPVRAASYCLKLQWKHEPPLVQLAEIIERQTTQLTALIDDLLDVARMTQGKIILRKQRVELGQIVSQAVSAAQALIDHGQHSLTVHLPEDPVHLEADPLRLEQVILNLLSNASRFSEPGGQIQIKATVEDGFVSFRVSDNGIGIATETLPKVFDIFFQAEPIIERMRGGLGIGLTVAKTLIQLHGGLIEAVSEGLGRGTTIHLRLPLLVGNGLTSPVPPEAVPEYAQRSRRVLVVEDNHDGAEMIALLLKHLGYDVHVAHDGQEGWEAIQDWRPDVVLLNIGLPSMTGYEVAERVRGNPLLRNTTLIAVSGFARLSELQTVGASGFDGHLLKPVALGDLLSFLSPPSTLSELPS
jgi:signal transduction histidine kinase